VQGDESTIHSLSQEFCSVNTDVFIIVDVVTVLHACQC
jgi:hypothetical protein